MAYIGSSPTKVVSRQSANIFTYTATANQTAFTGADANGNTLACTPSDIMVHMNGIKLEESDYTASTTTVTLGSGAAAGDEVTITAFVTFETADAYTKSASDTRYVNTTGDTMTGNLTVSGGLVSATGTSTATNPESDIGLYHSLKNLSSDVNTGVALSLGSNNNSGAIIYGQRTGGNNEHKMGFQTRNSSGSAATRMSIDGSGNVTKPNQPAFEAFVATGSGSTLASGIRLFSNASAFNGHVFTNLNFNIGSHYNSSNSRFTAPVAGRYLMYGGLATNSNNPSSAYLSYEFYINGSRRTNGWNAKAGGYNKESTFKIFNLSAGDYVEPAYESGSSISILSQGSVSNPYVYFGGHLLS